MYSVTLIISLLSQLCVGTLPSGRKNVILILTDDQDVELGSLKFMPKTTKLLRDRGLELEGGFVTTPICCPSRSSILTGLYVHNHNVHTNNQNCSGPNWRSKFEPRNFGAYLKESGYMTAYMGKYLNEYDGSYVPPGWTYWMGLIKNSRFYNYTVNLNGRKKKYGSIYETDYFTDVITNTSLDWLQTHIVEEEEVPFLLVLSYPAPHGPEDPAPQYANMFDDVETHRTEAWNYAPNPDKQWLLQHTGKMEPVHVAFTDILQRRRLQTLQSVDDSVHKVLSLLRSLNQLQNTYIMYTSDHGYHIGQFGLIKGKNMPYEFDIRVPFLMRGPGIPKNTRIRRSVANIDIAPTILDMAGIAQPPHMDGRSILQLIDIEKDTRKAQHLEPWRDTVLIERGKMPSLKKIRDRWIRQKARFTKELLLERECTSNKWSGSCSPSQAWKCYKDSLGRWRIYKCRDHAERECKCKRVKRDSPKNHNEDKHLDEFLREAHQRIVLESKQWFQGVFADHTLKSRSRRELRESCNCSKRNNTEHPLKHDWEAGIADDLLYFDYLPTQNSKKKRRPHKLESNNSCSVPQMNCFTHGSSHWRTPPFWPEDFGEFCFCQNTNNNTYWCLRTLNATHNFLYCEFVTEFISFYDLNEDPFQLTNMVYSLEFSVLETLSEQLRLLKSCKGKSECEIRSSVNWKTHLSANKSITPISNKKSAT